jgi:hypothetical protein
MSDVNDLLGFAIDKNPIDFADTFNTLLQQKQDAALEARRIELAQSMYVPAEDADEDPDDVGEDEFDYTEDDFEDMDDSDLDEIDLEDLDLDDIDLDLEGITDEDD